MQSVDNATGSQTNSKLVFWGMYLAAIMLVIYRGPTLAVPLWNIGNDDVMRLVQVRDLLSGQGWFDVMQYRLGVEGTPMHWSRLVDLPIAALIWLFSLVLPMDWAEAATMVIWPLLLIGPTLWALYHAVMRFGGEHAGVFGLIFGVMAIVVSDKFDPGSLDHHNVQLMLTALVLMAMMASGDSFRHGIVAGVASALSLTIGLETMLFVVSVSGAVAVIWVWKGQGVRNRTIGFAASFSATLSVVFLLTRPDLTPSTLQCDAFGLDLLTVGALGAGGLLVLALVISPKSPLIRLAGTVLLALGVLAVAKLYAPACLSNPLNQLHPDVVAGWLSRITETKSLIASIKTDGPGNFGLLITPILAMLYAVLLARTPERRTAALVLVIAIASAYAMTFYQRRGLFFLILICVVPIAAMLGQVYGKYKRTQSSTTGILVILLLLVSIPDVWSIGYMRLNNTRPVSINPAPQITGPFAQCGAPEHLAPLAGLPTGFIASSTDIGAKLLAATPHRVLSSNFHRNQDGIQAGLDLAKADLSTAHGLLLDLGVEYVVYCENDSLPLRLSVGNPEGLWPQLYAGQLPEFLELLSAPNDLIVTYKVKY